MRTELPLRKEFATWLVIGTVAMFYGCANISNRGAGNSDAALAEVIAKIEANTWRFSFAPNSVSLTTSARDMIREMALLLNHPGIKDRKIIIAGHTDATGTQDYNLRLSRRRAEAVAQELIFNGTRRSRFSIQAFGGSKPLVPDVKSSKMTEKETSRRNRRVEIVLAESRANSD